MTGMNKDLRKYSNNLIVAGTGVMFFGVWDVVKNLMLAFLGTQTLRDMLLTQEMPDNFPTLVFGYVIFAIALVIELAVRGYIGLNARAIGNGKRCPKRFVVISVLLLIINAAALVTSLFAKDISEYYSGFDRIITLIVDITSVYAMCEMLYALRKVNEIRRLKGRP